MPGASTESGKQKLWFLITALCIGGAEQTLVDLANEVDKSRYDVTIWTIFDENQLASDLDPSVTLRSLTDCGRVENGAVVSASNPLAYVTVPLRFCYVTARERPDLVQSFLLFDNVLARLAGLVSPATIVTGIRSVPNDPSPFRMAIDRLTCGLSDYVVSNSKEGAALAIRRGADPDRVRVIPNGRDVDYFDDASPETIRAELDIGDDELIVGTVGRLIERKGHFELVTAWAQVVEREPATRLLFVGDGQDRAAIEAHAAEVGCADSIEFLGNRRDVPAVLAAMDIFAFPSHFEGLPGAVIEAMAAGLPIVATPVDGTAELIEGYRTGLFVPTESPDELAWAITRLLEAPTLRTALGRAAHERARECYTMDVMVDQFEGLYEEIGVGNEIGVASSDRGVTA